MKLKSEIEEILSKTITDAKPDGSDDLIFLELMVPLIACDICDLLNLHDDYSE